ncbi:Sensor protein lytS [Myxococcus stipitatus DSM 14675]|uniref:Sensor protein lytS n=1 Tax=Myxococcus stipitatus (strain DSM 14675 / JCM 12634 / Mx s8) TaxID=1278073 RepID=L7U8R9_MYXSD|nr:histidine kinase [Myxococcus stipitatus]AGC43932.1 Sensor protein lytS [Myxococcus stipitatus DSM 14675]
MRDEDKARRGAGEVAPLPSWAVWTGALGWWLADAFVAVSQVRILQRLGEVKAPDEELWRMSLTSSLLWVPITVLCLRLSERVPLSLRGGARPWVAHLAALFGVLFGRAAFVMLTQDLVGWYERMPSVPDLLAQSVANNLLPFVLLTAGGHALGLARRAHVRQRRADQLQAQLAEARLQALASQLRPHFLFNALNAVASLVHADPDGAERMLARLGDLLRQSLESHGRQEVTLREELAALTPYLDIEQIRFGPRLQVAWSLAPDVMDARVPFLALQPLVENAIRHGLAPRAEPGRIEITAEREGTVLRLSVRDDGMGPPPEGPVRVGGVGLSNLRARLVTLYGPRAGLELRRGTPRGAVAELRVPLDDGLEGERVAA